GGGTGSNLLAPTPSAAKRICVGAACFSSTIAPGKFSAPLQEFNGFIQALPALQNLRLKRAGRSLNALHFDLESITINPSLLRPYPFAIKELWPGRDDVFDG